jgi:hypothetical protein
MKYTVPIVFACTLITISAFAKSDSSGKKLTDAERIARREARRKEFNEYYGGFIQDTRQQKGMIAVVNAQSELDVKCLTAPIEWLKSEVKIRFEVTSKTFDFPNVAKYGAMTIYLISDENIPSLLIAPEQKWCSINVRKLKSDKEAFFNARVQKEFMRAFAILCGAFASSYDNPVMGHISKVEDLDNIIDYRLPKDIIKKCSSYLGKNGVTPYKRTTFRQACEEGWAPAPTNDVQKAIWDKVHATPKNPMKIEFDPQKGR